MDDKFGQISGIFHQFSEENKDKLLETAISLLKVQMEGVVSVFESKDVKKLKERCSKQKSRTG